MSERAALGELLDGAGPADRYGRLAPAPEVLVAIALAVEECWPRPEPRPAPASGWRRAAPSWRFSGRWWSGAVALRRERPGS
ncbi:MAG: hypothetical protein M0004_10690 [Actinomycetota bacterium]|nr:hypothetical protein [Actinomycetota bacterium]